MTAARYVYAVGRALDPTALTEPTGLAGLRGIDGADVQLVAYGDVVAVVSPAPDDAAQSGGAGGETGDEAGLQARLEHLDELAAIAEAHHAVVTAVAALTVVAPFRLATIYQDEHRVRELLHTRYGELRALLDRLDGTVEVGVKLYADDRPPAPAATGAGAADGSGKAYLRQLSRRHQRRDEEWRNVAAAVERVDTALGEHALDRNQHRPQPAQLSGASGRNVLNVAYLIPAARLVDFTEAARRLASGEPVRVAVTGPWAPYSFAEPGGGERS